MGVPVDPSMDTVFLGRTDSLKVPVHISPVSYTHLVEDDAHRVGEAGHLPDALCHAGDPALIQGQPVQHHLRDGPSGPLQIQGCLLYTSRRPAGRGSRSIGSSQHTS